MKNIKVLSFLIAIIFILAACTDKPEDNPPLEDEAAPPSENHEEENGKSEENTEDATDEEEISLSQFFLSDGSKAHYQGEGNEFAELNIDVHHIGENFVVVDEDNGGVTIRKIYRIEDDKISVLSEEPIDLNVELPSEEDLAELENEEIYLKKPLEIGTEFEDWTIIEVDGTVETPLQTFEGVLILESESEDFINRRYLVPDYGEVVRESIMETEDDTDFIVISSLKSIE